MKTRADLGNLVTYPQKKKKKNDNKKGEKYKMVFLFLFLGGWGINYKDGKRVYNNGSKIRIIKYLNSFFLINFAFLLKKKRCYVYNNFTTFLQQIMGD